MYSTLCMHEQSTSSVLYCIWWFLLSVRVQALDCAANDPCCLTAAAAALLLLAGVEYGVVRATFQQQLQQMLLTVLALWIPLIPLLFLAQRLVDSRNGTRRAKSSNSNAPRVTFADVAGEVFMDTTVVVCTHALVSRHAACMLYDLC
jgi:hypothetical protein